MKKTFKIKEEEYKFDFSSLESNIDIYGKALNKLLMQDLVGAGTYIIDACYQGDIVELKKNTKLYASLAIQCATELEVFEAEEVKKNS